MTSLAAFERGYEQVFVKVAMTSGSAGTRQFSRGLLDVYSGQAAPPSIQTFTCATVSGRERGGNVRPSPGLHPQPTRSSSAMWWSTSLRDRPPFCFGSLICLQSSPAERPTNTILCSGEGSAHFGLPGG